MKTTKASDPVRQENANSHHSDHCHCVKRCVNCKCKAKSHEEAKPGPAMEKAVPAMS